MTPVRFHPEARAELDADAIWYDERRPGQGAVLLARLLEPSWIRAMQTSENDGENKRDDQDEDEDPHASQRVPALRIERSTAICTIE